jgi:hypothetical protein
MAAAHSSRSSSGNSTQQQQQGERRQQQQCRVEVLQHPTEGTVLCCLPASHCCCCCCNCRESLTRKALFYADTPAWQLLPLYINTMFRTQLPMYAAELIVACVYDAVDELRRLLANVPLPRQQQQHGGLTTAAGGGLTTAEQLVGAECLMQPDGGQLQGLALLQLQLQELVSGRVKVAPADVSSSTKRWLLRAAKNLLRVSGTAVCAAVGSGVASAVAPRERAGVWAVRGHIVSDLVFANVLMLVLDGGFALAFGPGPQLQQQQEQYHLSHFGLTS